MKVSSFRNKKLNGWIGAAAGLVSYMALRSNYKNAGILKLDDFHRPVFGLEIITGLG